MGLYREQNNLQEFSSGKNKESVVKKCRLYTFMAEVFWQCHGSQATAYFWIQKLGSDISINAHACQFASQSNYWQIDTSSWLLIIMSLLELSQLFQISTPTLAVGDFFAHIQKLSFALKFQAKRLWKKTKWKQANKPSPARVAQPQRTGREKLLERLGTNHRGHTICNFRTEYSWQYTNPK